MRKTIFLLLALIVVSQFVPNSAFAWDTTAAKYYPLKVGNTYTFENIQYLQGCFGMPTGKFKTVIARDTVLSNGKRYFEFQSKGSVYALFNSYWKYQRIDSSSMNVYGYSITENKEYLLDSLKAVLGSNFKCLRFPTTTPNGTYLGPNSGTYFGRIMEAKTILCSPNTTSYRLLENVGFIGYSYCIDFGEGMFLLGCVVNNVLYGDTTTTDVRQISSEVPDKFSLKQNYPNPFNPSTKIIYELKSAGFVSLKVYNVMGKEVTELVNEKQHTGIYEVTFDGINLPSGVYYYKIEADGFTDVKKMSLIK